MASRTGPSLHLHEYNIIESSGRVKQRIHSNEDVTVNVDVYSEGGYELLQDVNLSESTLYLQQTRKRLRERDPRVENLRPVLRPALVERGSENKVGYVVSGRAQSVIVNMW